MRAFLDTHAAVFLWSGRIEEFGRRSRRLLEGAELAVSPVVKLELALLYEIGRLTVAPQVILGALLEDCGVHAVDDPMPAVIEKALPITWTRDPFDRLLVATAALHRAPLVTRDAKMQAHFEGAVW